MAFQEKWNQALRILHKIVYFEHSFIQSYCRIFIQLKAYINLLNRLYW